MKRRDAGPSGKTAVRRTELDTRALRDVQPPQVVAADENLVAARAGQRIDVALDHPIELLAAPGGDAERRLCARCLLCGLRRLCVLCDGAKRREVRLAVRR